MEFTSHNIVLSDGSETRPGWPHLVDSGICQAALRDLAVAFPGGLVEDHIGIATTWRTATVADLGCLEGGYSVAFARAGYEVTGVEVNPDNFACCEYVRERVKLPVSTDLRFVQADVRDLDQEFDAIFCCGLLYHLDEPVKFLRRLGKLTRRMLILQTHYDMSGSEEENEGFRGRWWQEDLGERWASADNPRSFWLAKADLVAVLLEAGFRLVFQQFDYLTDVRSGKYLDQHAGTHMMIGPMARGMFVAIK